MEHENAFEGQGLRKSVSSCDLSRAAVTGDSALRRFGPELELFFDALPFPAWVLDVRDSMESFLNLGGGSKDFDPESLPSEELAKVWSSFDFVVGNKRADQFLVELTGSLDWNQLRPYDPKSWLLTHCESMGQFYRGEEVVSQLTTYLDHLDEPVSFWVHIQPFGKYGDGETRVFVVVEPTGQSVKAYAAKGKTPSVHDFPFPSAAIDLGRVLERLEEDGIRSPEQVREKIGAEPAYGALLDDLVVVVQENRASRALRERLSAGFVPSDFGSPEHGRRRMDEYAYFLGGDRPLLERIEFEGAGGERIVVEQSIRGYRAEDGRVVRAVLHRVDITERVVAEERAQELFERYRTLFENAPVGLIEIDFAAYAEVLYAEFGEDREAGLESIEGDGIELDALRSARIVRFNREAERIYGVVDIGNILGASRDAFQQSHRRRVSEAVSHLVREGRDVSPDIEILDTLGNERTIRVTSAVLHRTGPWPSRILYAVTDVTKEVEAYRKLYRLSRDLEQRVEEKTQGLLELNYRLEAYAYSVSHDLSSPLRSLSSILRGLERAEYGALPVEALARVSEAAGQVEGLGEMTKALLDLAALGRRGVRKGNAEMAGVWEASWRLAQFDHFSEGTYEVLETGRVYADADLLTVLWFNLFTNALKFRDEERELRIQVGFEEWEGRRWWFIRDTGRGIDMKWTARIFEPFRRSPEAQDTPGIGVGLATVKSIVELHGGEIEIFGEPGAGTTVRYWLPEEGADHSRFKAPQNI